MTSLVFGAPRRRPRDERCPSREQRALMSRVALHCALLSVVDFRKSSVSLNACTMRALLSMLAFALVLGAVSVSVRGEVRVQALLPAPLASTSPAVALSGRDAITVVFERAVIALGADFGERIPPELVPLELQGANVPGKTRWCACSFSLLSVHSALPDSSSLFS